MNLQYSLSQDSAQMRIEISDDEGGSSIDLPAEDVDNLILNLAIGRAKMVPEIPRTLDPNPVFRNYVHSPVLHISKYQTPPSNKLGVLFALHHPGLGWIAVPMDAKSAGEFAMHMARVGSEVAMASPLVRPDGRPI